LTIDLYYCQFLTDKFTVNTNNNFGLRSAGGVYGLLADAGADIFRANGIGPLAKWVDNQIFFQILATKLPAYSDQRRIWHDEIQANGGQVKDGSRIWYRGKVMLDGSFEEFDEDMIFLLWDFSIDSRDSEEFGDNVYSYGDEEIDGLSNSLGIKWEKSETTPFSFTVTYCYDQERFI